MPTKSRVAITAMAILVGSACDEEGTMAPVIPGALFAVGGTVTNETGAPIPSGARVLVAWLISSGPDDHAFAYGEGEFDGETGSFELGFFDVPPAEALNANGLGVGLLIVVDDPELTSGDRIDEPSAGILGISENHAVIYLDGDPDQIGTPSETNWAASFEEGFNVGRGIDLEGVFDGFEPASSDEIVITLDDLEDLEFVDWT